MGLMLATLASEFGSPRPTETNETPANQTSSSTDSGCSSATRKDAKDLFFKLFGKKRTNKSTELFPGITPMVAAAEQPTTQSRQTIAENTTTLPKISNPVFDNMAPNSPRTAPHNVYTAQKRTVHQLQERCVSPAPCEKILELICRYLQQSLRDKDLATCVGSEVKQYLRDVIKYKISAANFIRKLRVLFGKFQCLPELSLDTEYKTQSLVYYFDELRNVKDNMFENIALQVKSRFPDIFGHEDKHEATTPQQLPLYQFNFNEKRGHVGFHCSVNSAAGQGSNHVRVAKTYEYGSMKIALGHDEQIGAKGNCVYIWVSQLPEGNRPKPHDPAI